jgi:prepilin-type N-terminal cleavage/methylation domain-containing protein
MSRHRKKSNAAFTLLELMIVISIIGILCTIMISNVLQARSLSQCENCIGNMRQIENSCQQFAIDMSLASGDEINFPQDITPYIKLNSSGSIPPCPAGGSYSLLPAGNNPQTHCSLESLPDMPHILP